MDENNNNQVSESSETEETSVPVVKNLDPKLLVAVIVLVLVVVGIVVTMLSKTQNSIQPDIIPTPVPEVVAPATLPGPEKISAGEALPEGFPKDTLAEPNSKLDQSYTIKYPEGEQSTVVFASSQGLKKEYATYLAQLKKDAWIIVSAKETDKISVIYAMKDNSEINITLVQNGETSTEVSISTFNK